MSNSAVSSDSTDTQRYDANTIRYHWISAATVATLWVIAQIIDDFPKGMPRVYVRSVHILLGVAFGVLLLARIYWRVRHGRKLPAANAGLVGRLAQGVHYLLYFGLVATVALGVTNVWVRGDNIAGLFTVPKLSPGDMGLKHLVEGLHMYFANTLVIVAAAHALAALAHHFVLKDGVLRRMLPARERN